MELIVSKVYFRHNVVSNQAGSVCVSPSSTETDACLVSKWIMHTSVTVVIPLSLVCAAPSSPVTYSWWMRSWEPACLHSRAECSPPLPGPDPTPLSLCPLQSAGLCSLSYWIAIHLSLYPLMAFGVFVCESLVCIKNTSHGSLKHNEWESTLCVHLNEFSLITGLYELNILILKITACYFRSAALV